MGVLDYLGGNQTGSRNLYGDSFAELRRRLGLSENPDLYQGFVDPNITGFGRSYLNDNEGQGALYDLFASSFRNRAPALADFTLRNKSRIEDQYKAAAAVDNTLTRERFLEGYDPERLRKQSDWMQRGERPWAFQRGFKSMGG